MHTVVRSAAIVAILVIFSFLAVPVATHEMNMVSGAIFHQDIGLQNGNSVSANWAGYAVVGGNDSVANVTESFLIPAVNTGGNSYAAFWVGIDGFNGNTVEQTGILAEPSGHGPHSATQYLVWYEFYPASPVYASFTASAGDNVYASVNYSAGQFTTYIAVYSTGHLVGTLYHTQAVSGALDDSAEWIVEAPSSTSGILPLANFGTAYFGQNYTKIALTNYATVNGAYGPIGSFGSNVQSITMVTTSGTPEATPSSLNDGGSSFTVTYDQVSPSHHGSGPGGR